MTSKFDLDTVRCNAVRENNKKYLKTIEIVHNQIEKNKCTSLKEACEIANIKYSYFNKAKIISEKNLAFIREYEKKYKNIIANNNDNNDNNNKNEIIINEPIKKEKSKKTNDKMSNFINEFTEQSINDKLAKKTSKSLQSNKVYADADIFALKSDMVK
jgi:uncharacterized membrane protein